jgi:hypothetical protein
MRPVSSIASQVDRLKSLHNALRVGKGIIKGATKAGSNGTDRIGALQGRLTPVIREQETPVVALHSGWQERNIRLQAHIGKDAGTWDVAQESPVVLQDNGLDVGIPSDFPYRRPRHHLNI